MFVHTYKEFCPSCPFKLVTSGHNFIIIMQPTESATVDLYLRKHNDKMDPHPITHRVKKSVGAIR